MGYWPHREFDWTDAIRTATQLAADHSLTMPVRGMDLFHIAIALQVDAEAFITFDIPQADFAKIAGLRLIR